MLTVIVLGYLAVGVIRAARFVRHIVTGGDGYDAPSLAITCVLIVVGWPAFAAVNASRRRPS